MDEFPYVVSLDEEDRPLKPLSRARRELGGSYWWFLHDSATSAMIFTALDETTESKRLYNEIIHRVRDITWDDFVVNSLTGFVRDVENSLEEALRIYVTSARATYDLDVIHTAPKARPLSWGGTTGRRRTRQRQPSQASHLYERRLRAYEKQQEERSLEEELRQTEQKHRLVSALMDDHWLGLRLLTTVAEARNGMTMTELLKATNRDADHVAPMLAALSRYGVVEVVDMRFVVTSSGSDVLENLDTAIDSLELRSRS